MSFFSGLLGLASKIGWGPIVMAGTGIMSAIGGSQSRGRTEGEFDPRRMESAPDYVPRKMNILVDPYTGAYYNNIEDRDRAIAQSRQNMGVMAAAQGGYIQSYNTGGFIQGPGTGTSDSIPASIYQNGSPVQEARLSDGEFVMTKKAVDNSGGAPAMYARMKQFENGGMT